MAVAAALAVDREFALYMQAVQQSGLRNGCEWLTFHVVVEKQQQLSMPIATAGSMCLASSVGVLLLLLPCCLWWGCQGKLISIAAVYDRSKGRFR